jgi:hypothetical protein
MLPLFLQRLANMYALAPVGMAHSKVMIATSLGSKRKRWAVTSQAMAGIAMSLRKLMTPITAIPLSSKVLKLRPSLEAHREGSLGPGGRALRSRSGNDAADEYSGDRCYEHLPYELKHHPHAELCQQSASVLDAIHGPAQGLHAHRAAKAAEFQNGVSLSFLRCNKNVSARTRAALRMRV